jgi:hypothetical protein
MTTSAPARRPSVGARRFGYLVAAVVNVALLYFANVWPGWDALPFLTADTVLVMAAINASISVNLFVNVVYLFRDDPPLKSLGDLATMAVGLFALVRVWVVFPFDFGSGFDWAIVVRVLLVAGMVGSVLAIVATVVGLARWFGGHRTARPAHR